MIFAAVALAFSGSADAQRDDFQQPDTLVLKNGTVVRGLIIRNSATSVLIQEKFEENVYPKSQITRIRDEADLGVMFTDINRKGALPPWRVIANDLRTHDEIRSLVEIPATLVDNGEFRNVPYKSFRANRNVELNVYGDPADPAGVEMGIYGPKSNDDKLRKTLRSYLAGFLTTRAEVAALYGLKFSGGIADAGDIRIEITPADAPDAYGAWWISLYNRKRLSAVRLDDAEYARMVRPVDQVIDKKGRVIANGWSGSQIDLSPKIGEVGAAARVIMRGFYRDDKGDFRLIQNPGAEKMQAN